MVLISMDEGTITVGAMLSRGSVLTSSKVDSSRKQGIKITKASMLGSFEGKTTLQGPLYFGMCVGFNSTTLAEFFDADPQGQIEDQDQPENGAFIKVLGVIPAVETGGRIQGMTDTWTDAQKNWSVPEGSSLQMFVFNASGGTMTTGTLVDWQMWLNYIWLKD